MGAEPKFLEIKEVNGYFWIRRVYVPKQYENIVLRKPYDPIIEHHIGNVISRVNAIKDPSERKEQLMTQLEEILG